MKSLSTVKGMAVKAAAGICMTMGVGAMLLTTTPAAESKNPPEIVIHTDRLEQVERLEAKNQQARELLADYSLVDRDLDDVLEDLIYKMMLDGCFENGDGTHAVITIQDNQASKETLDAVNEGLETYLREKEEMAGLFREHLGSFGETPKYNGQMSEEKWDIIGRLLNHRDQVTAKEMETIGLDDLLVYARACNISTERLEERLEEVSDRYRNNKHLQDLENRMDQINDKYDPDDRDDWDDFYDRDDIYDDDDKNDVDDDKDDVDDDKDDVNDDRDDDDRDRDDNDKDDRDDRDDDNDRDHDDDHDD